MAIWRGVGGSGESTNDSTVPTVTELLVEAEAAKNAAELAETNAETAASNAASSASTASTQASNASTSATNAASSASAASTSAANASSSASTAAAQASSATTSATNAANSATAANTSASNAASSAISAASSASTATTKANEAATSATNAAAYELSANNWATKTSGPVAGSEYSAKYNAQLAATSATNAASSASSASTSSTNAASSATSAASSATAAAASYDSFDDRYLGPKSSAPTLDNDGNALLTGALYFNTATNTMKVWNGSAWLDAYASLSGALLATNNLADLNNVATARTNLGLGTAATQNSTAFATAAQGTNADTAFSWGNHALAGYAADSAVVKLTGDQTIAGIKTFSSNPIVSAGTANGVAYLNGSKVLTTGSALTFDGTTFTNTGNTVLGDASTDTVTVNGYMGVGSAANSSYGINLQSTSLSGAAQAGIRCWPQATSAATTAIDAMNIRAQTAASAFTTARAAGLVILDATLGAGSAITNQYGILIADQAQGTNNYGITSQVSSGSNKWNIYASGTAQNYFAGNVGIGTTSPGFNLEVTGAASSSSTVRVTGGSGANTNAVLDLTGRGSGSQFNNTEIRSIGAATNGGTLTFHTDDTSAALQERMRIDSAGNLGIGTSSPAYKLDVAGDIALKTNATYLYGKTSGGAVTRTFGINGSNLLYIGSIDAAISGINFNVNGTNQAVLDSSGNLGIGTTSPGTRLQIGNPSDSNQALRFDFSDSSTARINSTRTGSGNTQSLILAGQDTLQFYTNGSERARIDSSGNVGIGTSSPSYKLHVAGSGDVYGQIATSNGGAYFNLDVQAATPDYKAIWGTVAGVRKWGIGNYGTSASDVIAFYTGGATERARIDSSGNLYLNTTSNINQSRFAIAYDPAAQQGINMKATTANNGVAIQFVNSSNTVIGTISNTTTATAYNTSSDYRLKENIQPMTGALAKVSALKPCIYTWKADGSDGEGFIAHELAEVCPNAVTGKKDAVNEDGSIKPQGIDTSFLVATLTAAIKEQQALIESLTTRIAALEGK